MDKAETKWRFIWFYFKKFQNIRCDENDFLRSDINCTISAERGYSIVNHQGHHP